MPVAPYGLPSCWLTVITIDEVVFGASREQARLHLAAHGIESRPAWKPMHLQPLYSGGAASRRARGRADLRRRVVLAEWFGADRGRAVPRRRAAACHTSNVWDSGLIQMVRRAFSNEISP